MPTKFFIIWSDKWELGIPILDEQHRGAAALINSMYYFFSNKHGMDVISKVIRSVAHYSELHMFTEEYLLAQAQYPKLEHHRKMHAHLSHNLREVVQKTIGAGDYGAAPEALMDLFRHWWIDHVNIGDKEFAPFLRAYIDSLPQGIPPIPHTYKASFLF